MESGGFNSFDIDQRIQKTDWLSDLLIHQRDQPGPQRCDCARPSDHHGLAITDHDLGRGFATVDTWTSRIASCTDCVSGCANLHHDLLTDFLGISRGNLRSHIQFQVRIHKGCLSPLEGGRLERDRFPL